MYFTHHCYFRCIASNGHGAGASKEMEVIVRYRPEVEVSEVFVHKKEGDEAELVCSVHAYPTATVRIAKSAVLHQLTFVFLSGYLDKRRLACH